MFDLVAFQLGQRSFEHFHPRCVILLRTCYYSVCNLTRSSIYHVVGGKSFCLYQYVFNIMNSGIKGLDIMLIQYTAGWEVILKCTYLSTEIWMLNISILITAVYLGLPAANG